MKRGWIVGLIIGLVVIAILIAGLFFVHPYKPYKLAYDPMNVPDGAPIIYYQSCVCIGQLFTLESYPLQYKCDGINLCSNINETVYRDTG